VENIYLGQDVDRAWKNIPEMIETSAKGVRDV
jgi:hypothetical protein